jgi:hypothetical protein
MEAADSRATVVLCATVPPAAAGGRRGDGLQAARAGVAVTWIASWDGLTEIAAGGSLGQHDVALDLPLGSLTSRQRVRTLLARARDAFPNLDTVALHGDADRHQRRLLVDEGIRAVLVDQLSVDGRGSRRPAPRGWRCRNAAWGLWDIEAAAHRPRGMLSWLGQGMPWLRRGGLHVVKTEGMMVGSGGRAFFHPRLERWLAWAGHQVERGTAQTQTVRELVACLTGEARQPLAGSVLRAA